MREICVHLPKLQCSKPFEQRPPHLLWDATGYGWASYWDTPIPPTPKEPEEVEIFDGPFEPEIRAKLGLLPLPPLFSFRSKEVRP
jgi:hypothetical protein